MSQPWGSLSREGPRRALGPGLKKKGSLCRCVSVSLGAVCFNLGGPTSSREGPRGALGDPIRPDPGCLNLGGPPPLPGRPTEGLPIDFDLISTLIRPSRPDPGCLNLGGPSPGVCVCVSRRGVFQPWGTDLLPGRPTGAPSDRTAHGGPLRPDVRCVAPRRASAQTDLCGGVREKMSHRKPVLFGGKPPSMACRVPFLRRPSFAGGRAGACCLTSLRTVNAQVGLSRSRSYMCRRIRSRFGRQETRWLTSSPINRTSE